MRYLLPFAFFFIGFAGLSAQDAELELGKNEVKLNALYLLIGAFEASYEYNLNEESSLGASLTFVYEVSDFNFGLTPYYRLFFGRKPAAGFFVEGNAALFSYDEYDDCVTDSNGFCIDFSESAVTAFGVGLSVGGKFLTKREVVVEVYTGVGRIFSSDGGAYPRIGINIGKRF
ncbi:MAG: DUF3575 domain-containing protein [Bacteroidia bacterium]|nr:DUF3575 domain-containing protein [Bacteroidia bacterium]